LSDYKIENQSTVIGVLRMQGGVWPLDAIRDKTQQLTPLPGYITVTSLESEEDIISLDNSPTERRAKMPCGHVIGMLHSATDSLYTVFKKS